jgi:iron(III) transport system ATP-binding protein
MNQGRIAQEGAPVDLYERPADAFVADFIGGANLARCEVLGWRDGMARVQLGPLMFELPAQAEPKEAAVVIRPAAVRLQALPGSDTFPARIAKATYLGSHWDYTLQSEIGELFVSPPEAAGYRAGDDVHVRLLKESLALVSGGPRLPG